jgi:hypothetical protein
MIGAWRRTIKKDSVHLETRAFSPFTPAQKKAIAAAGKRYAKFLELSLQK